VIQLSFSPDELFLAGCDDNPKGAKLCVWQCQTGQLATIAKTGQRPSSFIAWGEVIPSKSKTKKTSTYKLMSANAHKVFLYTLDFDIYTMQYAITAEAIALPSSGLERSYYCAQAMSNTRLVAGSHAGELVVFNTQTGIFRACVPVSQGGLLALTATEDGGSGRHLVYCGCGDGTLTLLGGDDLDWEVFAQTTLNGSVLTVTLSSDKTSLLAGTNDGNVYLLDAQTLALVPNANTAKPEAPLLACHPKPITCLAFGESSECFITGSSNGTLRRWELSHYCVEYQVTIKAQMQNKSSSQSVVQPECFMIHAAQLISGWSDGAIRCFEEGSGATLFEIPGAHRGPVSCICLTSLYVVSGGHDGSVRIWSDEPSHSLVGNFDEHRGKVRGLVVDKARPNLVYSAGEDKTLVTIDLGQARRTHCHVVKEGPFSGLAQSPVGDLELLSCDNMGCVKWWDSDVSDQPLSMLVTWSPQDSSQERKLTSISISPASPTGEGEYLLLATITGDLQVWDLRQPERCELISQGSAHSDAVTQACWSPDGKQVVSVGKDALICVWNFYGAN